MILGTGTLIFCKLPTACTILRISLLWKSWKLWQRHSSCRRLHHPFIWNPEKKKSSRGQIGWICRIPNRQSWTEMNRIHRSIHKQMKSKVQNYRQSLLAASTSATHAPLVFLSLFEYFEFCSDKQFSIGKWNWKRAVPGTWQVFIKIPIHHIFYTSVFPFGGIFINERVKASNIHTHTHGSIPKLRVYAQSIGQSHW